MVFRNIFSNIIERAGINLSKSNKGFVPFSKDWFLFLLQVTLIIKVGKYTAQHLLQMYASFNSSASLIIFLKIDQKILRSVSCY